MNMSLEEVRRYAVQFTEENYGIRFKASVKINGRLKRTLGRFLYNRNSDLRALEFGREFLTFHDRETIKDVIRHECIHYALYELGKPFKDGEPYFEEQLKVHNAKSTNVIESKGRFHSYACSSGHRIVQRNKFRVSDYVCKCGGSFEYKGVKVVH